MASFEVKVIKVDKVFPIPERDRIHLAKAEGQDYQFIVPISVQPGCFGIYIPEQALVPENIIKEMGLEGRLSGSAKNRVKAIKMGGVLSQGLFYVPEQSTSPVYFNVVLADNSIRQLELDNIQELLELAYEEDLDLGPSLDIKKYEPQVPAQMAGKVYVPPSNATRVGNQELFRTYTDIENIKKFPGVFSEDEDEQVYYTEKLHGTCCIFGLVGGVPLVSSKGMAGKGFALQEEDTNLYWRIARKFNIFEKLEDFCNRWELQGALFFGEGLGVQDLTYGCSTANPGFYLFDIYVGTNQAEKYLTPTGFLNFFNTMQIAGNYDLFHVPVLYEGKFDKKLLEVHTSGLTTVLNSNNIREGVVVRPVYERNWYDNHGNAERAILKSISPDYLTRKGNTTEFN